MGSPNATTVINGDVNDTSGSVVGAVHLYTNVDGAWNYDFIKASNAENMDRFGSSIDLSDDGNVLVVGANTEDSGDQSNLSDNSVSDSGAIYVFERTNGEWQETAYLKASNLGSSDRLGYSVAISGDGETIVVGAPFEDSAATGINGNEADDSNSDSGAIYVFRKSSGSWVQESYIKPHNTGGGDRFGSVVDISSDGNTVLATSPSEDSSITGVSYSPFSTDDSMNNTGAAYIFKYNGTNWEQEVYAKPLFNSNGYQFGQSGAISGDGHTFAISTPDEESGSTGINGDDTDTSAWFAGAAYVFSDSSGSWAQEAYIKASNAEEQDHFGSSIDISDDGNTVVVGAWGEDSNATGINGDKFDNSLNYPGAGYVFERSLGVWSEIAYIKQPLSEDGDDFGYAIALSGDGGTITVTADEEDGGSPYSNGDLSDNSASDSGAVYMY